MPRPPRADAAAVNVVVRFSPLELGVALRLAEEARSVSLSAFLRALVAAEAERQTGKRGRPKGIAGKRKARRRNG